MLLNERQKGQEYEVEHVSIYWVNFRKQEDNGNQEKKQQIALPEKLALEETMNLSNGRLLDGGDDDNGGSDDVHDDDVDDDDRCRTKAMEFWYSIFLLGITKRLEKQG